MDRLVVRSRVGRRGSGRRLFFRHKAGRIGRLTLQRCKFVSWCGYFCRESGTGLDAVLDNGSYDVRIASLSRIRAVFVEIRQLPVKRCGIERLVSGTSLMLVVFLQ